MDIESHQAIKLLKAQTNTYGLVRDFVRALNNLPAMSKSTSDYTEWLSFDNMPDYKFQGRSSTIVNGCVNERYVLAWTLAVFWSQNEWVVTSHVGVLNGESGEDTTLEGQRHSVTALDEFLSRLESEAQGVFNIEAAQRLVERYTL